jgi:methionyl aminopeptidase
MTEKSYGGNNGVREHTNKPVTKLKDNSNKLIQTKQKKSPVKSENNSKLNELESYKKAGEISIKVKEFARALIKPNMPLVEIAQKIEKEIIKLGAQPAFPVNLSIDDIAAHYHPTLEDETMATGLLKIDIGIHVNGFIADSAFSLDLTPDNKHKELIKASEEALENALKLLDKNPTLSEIGETIQKTISSKGFSPVINLSGHALDQYEIHAGITIPNSSNNSNKTLEPGAYAIEPFATTGEGRVIDGPSSNIYKIINPKTPRSPSARAILEYIWEKNQTLPFSMRELQEKFGNISRLAIKELEQNNIIHNYPQLIEVSRKPVSQAEHTFIKTPEGKIIITTK